MSGHMGWSLGLALAAIGSLANPALAADKRVCVEVVEIGLYEDPAAQVAANKAQNEAVQPPSFDALAAEEPPSLAPKLVRPKHKARPRRVSENVLPLGQSPIGYLKRLIEHFVTHEKGYVAGAGECDATLHVELYPLREGWTVFARYSANGREERVDQLFATELSQFAERVVLALLADTPISATINRDTVLGADSVRSSQRIKGSHHYVLGLGTKLRGGQFDTVITQGADTGDTSRELRLFFPMTIATGYRGRFENWGIESLVQVDIGTSKKAAYKNPAGGHIDFGGDAGLQLHFLRYLNPRGLNSFYLGAGATFELLWLTAVKAETQRGQEDRSTLLGGGLDVDLVVGWEFMRASSVQFYLQGELVLPAYALQTEDNHGEMNTWFPGLAVKLGVMF